MGAADYLLLTLPFGVVLLKLGLLGLAALLAFGCLHPPRRRLPMATPRHSDSMAGSRRSALSG